MPRKKTISPYKKGWNMETVKREELIAFLNRISRDLHIPMLHIHIVPGSPFSEEEDLLDVLFYFNPKAFG